MVEKKPNFSLSGSKRISDACLGTRHPCTDGLVEKLAERPSPMIHRQMDGNGQFAFWSEPEEKGVYHDTTSRINRMYW